MATTITTTNPSARRIEPPRTRPNGHRLATALAAAAAGITVGWLGASATADPAPTNPAPASSDPVDTERPVTIENTRCGYGSTGRGPC